MKTTAPWSQEQVDRLAAFQRDGRVHPFTCPGDRACCKGDDEARVLVPTTEGWVCRCGHYRQAWAFGFMLRPLPPEEGT